MDLLGEDGYGYELARKLEVCGVWRSWLGDTSYANFVDFLTSPSSWEAFMRVDDGKTRAQIELQLRVRALLFDKASVSLFLRPQSVTSLASSSQLSVSKLNPNYLQLHGDDVYFTLDNCGVCPNFSKRSRHEELPDSWYSQFIEKYSAGKPYKLSFGDGELDMRTPIEMSAYLSLSEKHKRERKAFMDDEQCVSCNETIDNKTNCYLNPKCSQEDDILLLPEIMFSRNCVPDTALHALETEEDEKKTRVYGVLDMLPRAMARSPIMIERLGIRPEYINMEQCGSAKDGSERSRKHLSQDQALQLSKKAVGRVLTDIGFEGANGIPAEALSQLLSCHISKFGRTLKVLADSYRKKCSAIELVKMLLSYTGHSDLGDLMEYLNDNKPTAVQQNQDQGQETHSQRQLFQKSPLQQHQQLQWDRMQRRQQQYSPLSAVSIDKGSPIPHVKSENSPEMTSDSASSYSTVISRHPHYQQLQQQQQHVALSNFETQSGSPFKSPSILQSAQINMGTPRTLPVKVEGFQELMGTESLVKSEIEDSGLTSPAM